MELSKIIIGGMRLKDRKSGLETVDAKEIMYDKEEKLNK